MKNHKEVYFKYFGISHGEFVPCEICQENTNDIYHIKARTINGIFLMNNIHNLMALCKRCYNNYGNKKKMMNDLIKIHNSYIENHDIKKNEISEML